MYANRFTVGPRFRPASLGAALAINAGVIAALLFAKPELIPGVKPEPPIKIIDVVEPEPPQPPPQPEQRTKPQPQPTSVVTTPKSEVATKSENPLKGDPATFDPPPIGAGTGTGTGTIDPPVPPPIPPAFVAARQDPRYVGEFQPPYPDFERDAGREGVVKLRIRIGTDGRVKQVERLDGRDSFARAATAHALAKWRFEPATRGGVPEESWMTMTVRFTLQ